VLATPTLSRPLLSFYIDRDSFRALGSSTSQYVR